MLLIKSNYRQGSLLCDITKVPKTDSGRVPILHVPAGRWHLCPKGMTGQALDNLYREEYKKMKLS